MRHLREKIEQRKKQSLYRHRRLLESSQSTQPVINGKSFLAFCSNDYLGLANDHRIKAAFKSAVDRVGVGMGASALMLGYHASHKKLEEALAEFLGRSSAILFSSGYMANLGVLSSLLSRHDSLYQDRLNHASLIDAGRLSRAKVKRYQHCDYQDLQRLMSADQSEYKLLVTDGLFSMDGDLAPMAELVAVAASMSADVMVDDAHGIGVLGKKGKGSLELAGLDQQQVPVLVGTFGKAFGTFGAFVAGSDELIEMIVQYSRSYIYTTAPPPAIAEATLMALNLIQTESWRREKSQLLVQRFIQGAKQLGLSGTNSVGPIQAVMLGSAEKAVEVSEALWQLGIVIPAIRPPTVPENSARLRVSISATHTEQQIDRLLDALADICKRPDNEA